MPCAGYKTVSSGQNNKAEMGHLLHELLLSSCGYLIIDISFGLLFVLVEPCSGSSARWNRCNWLIFRVPGVANGEVRKGHEYLVSLLEDV